MDDLVSRELAIEALSNLVSSMSVCGSKEECRGMKEMQNRAVTAIKELPQKMMVERRVQRAEPLTDKEQRIFLAAMGREEDVCKQVDDECRDCREPYEDSLVRTCHEIIRKVKGALWT